MRRPAVADCVRPARVASISWQVTDGADRKRWIASSPAATPCLTLSSGWAPRVASDDGIILAIIVNVHVRTTARSAVADRKTAVTQVRACEAG